MEKARKKLGQRLTRKVMEMQNSNVSNVEIGNLEDLSIKERARILFKLRITNSFEKFKKEIAKMNSIVVILLFISATISIAGWTCLISMLIKRFM